MTAKRVNEKQNYYTHTQLHTANELEVSIFQIKPFEIIASASIDLRKAGPNDIDKLIDFIEKNTRGEMRNVKNKKGHPNCRPKIEN